MANPKRYKILETCVILGFVSTVLPVVDLVDHHYLSEIKSQAGNVSEALHALVASRNANTLILPSEKHGSIILSANQTDAEENNFSLPIPTITSTKSTTLTMEPRKLDSSNKSDTVAQTIVRNKRLLALADPLSHPLGPIRSATGEPYFDVNQTTIHVTVKAGENVSLDCTVIMLHGRTVNWIVSWLRKRHENLQLITVGNASYYSDPRLNLQFRYPENWRLSITSLQKQDEGEYHCQVSTHPAKTLIYHLMITAPVVGIQDENGHLVTERHYKVDSSLHLTCKATNTDQFEEKVSWLKGDRPLRPGTDNRIKIKVRKGEELGEEFVQLSILGLHIGDSGAYTCKVGSYSNSSATVHVVNGELPAAVQRGESEAIRLRVPAQRVIFCALALLILV